MLGLRELQAAFKHHLFEGDGDIAEHITSAHGPDRELRLAIYANAIVAKLKLLGVGTGGEEPR